MMRANDIPRQDAAYVWSGALIDELARGGVRHACLCPGSRSTPLALTLAYQSTIKPWVHIDERSAGFFALGLARATGSPVALLCTSGTAAANFLPAIVEARYARIPLVALTADRPPELRDNGAPQAIDQTHLYGRHVKWFVDLAIPEATEIGLRYVRTTASRAAALAVEGPAGPVHLNVPFREPLLPSTLLAGPGAAAAVYDGSPAPWPGAATFARPDGKPYARTVAGRRTVAFDREIAALAAEIAATQRGVIVCGSQPDRTLAPAVASLSRLTGYPILADPLSGMRSGQHDRTYVLDAYDAFLRAERAGALAPDLAIRFGAPPTSKALQTFLQQSHRLIVVDPDDGWREPTGRADTVIHADPIDLCRRLGKYSPGIPRVDWANTWLAADRCARDAMTAYLVSLDELFEGKVFAELSELLPPGATLFTGSSMPVRDMETFFRGRGRDVRCLSNRGANGIDGVVSSALGAAAAGGPLVLVIGDLSFYHDLNGLLAARRHGLAATIVLINNDGGGIFSFLPQAALSAHFELLFGTPTGLDFRPAAEMYGCEFERVETWPAFRGAVAASVTAPGVQVIELRTDRARNVVLHHDVWAAVAEAVWPA